MPFQDGTVLARQERFQALLSQRRVTNGRWHSVRLENLLYISHSQLHVELCLIPIARVPEGELMHVFGRYVGREGRLCLLAHRHVVSQVQKLFVRMRCSHLEGVCGVRKKEGVAGTAGWEGGGGEWRSGEALAGVEEGWGGENLRPTLTQLNSPL